MKNDWIAIIVSLQLGFCFNATLWRFEQGCTEDVGYPLGISIAMAGALFCRIQGNRIRHNAAMEPPMRKESQ
jgi:hypothetical protein